MKLSGGCSKTADKEVGVLMEKVKKVKLSIDKAEEIVRLDKVLQQSADLIIHTFIEKGIVDDPFMDSFDLKEVWIDQLEEQFKKSKFYHGEQLDVANAFDNTMYSLIELNDKNIIRIMYPILFYTLILKNFSNADTIKRREKRGSKSWGNTSNLLDIPDGPEKDDGHRKKVAELRENIERLTVNVKKKEAEISEILGKEDREDLYFQLRDIESLLMHAEAALYLLDSRKIAWLETMAQRALFVKDILESQKDNSPPIDTVLRLYVLNAMYGIMFTSECLSNGFRNNDLPGKYLLTSFREHNGILIDWAIKSGYKPKKVAEKEISLDDSVEISDDFLWLYGQLRKLTFMPEDVKDLLEYFFQENRLQWYLDCDEKIRKYAEAVLRGLRDFENINEKYFNLFLLSAPLQTKLFDDSTSCMT